MTIDPLGICNSASFRNEARWQRVCAVCHGVGSYQAHHVVYEQVLKRYGLKGHMLYDTTNALRICHRCHERHHHRVRPIRTGELTHENIRYAFHVMGAYAADWLRRTYDDSEADSRIYELESAA